MECNCLNQLVGRFLNVHVIEDHCRALAAQLALDRNQVSTAGFCDHAANFRRSGEAHATELRILRHGSTGSRTKSSDDVQNAVRKQLKFLNHMAQIQSGQRCVFCRLQHAGVASRECWREAPAGEQEWEVPGNDESTRAPWLARNPGFMILDCNYLAIIHRLRQIGKVAEGIDEILYVAQGLAVNLATVDGLDLGKFRLACFDRVGDSVQTCGSFSHLHLCPAAVMKCVHSDVYSLVDICLLQTGDGRNLLAGTWIKDVESLAISGFNPATSDK